MSGHHTRERPERPEWATWWTALHVGAVAALGLSAWSHGWGLAGDLAGGAVAGVVYAAVSERIAGRYRRELLERSERRRELRRLSAATEIPFGLERQVRGELDAATDALAGAEGSASLERAVAQAYQRDVEVPWETRP